MVQDLSTVSVACDLRVLLDPRFGLAQSCPRSIGSLAGLDRDEPAGCAAFVRVLRELVRDLEAHRALAAREVDL